MFEKNIYVHIVAVIRWLRHFKIDETESRTSLQVLQTDIDIC